MALPFGGMFCVVGMDLMQPDLIAMGESAYRAMSVLVWVALPLAFISAYVLQREGI